jgi:hypothetical protein
MQGGEEEPRVDDVINEIAALLATAYRRRARIRLVPTEPESDQSTNELEIRGETSVHGLTLTGERKESEGS